MLKSIHLKTLNNITHGFSTRMSGISEGLYESLNCGYGKDNPDHVEQNRALALKQLHAEGKPLCTLNQIHSDKVLVIEKPWAQGDAPDADAMVTNVSGLVIGVLTADCAPILMADEDTQVIAAIHAGWKGALNGVIENAIEEMLKLGARKQNIVAAIGPCIGKESYEVSDEFKDNFVKSHKSNNTFFSKAEKDGHTMFDLTNFVKSRIMDTGVMNVNALDHDTFQHEKLFFSYRRSTLNGEQNYGRQLAAICLT